MPALMDLSIISLDKDASLSRTIARILEIVKKSGLAYQLGPISGCVEGEWTELMDLATEIFNELSSDNRRLHIDMRIDWRKGGSGRIARGLPAQNT